MPWTMMSTPCERLNLSTIGFLPPAPMLLSDDAARWAVLGAMSITEAAGNPRRSESLLVAAVHDDD